MAYEWRPIFRSLAQAVGSSTTLVDIRTFDKTCLRHNVALTKEELKKVVKLFSPESREIANSARQTISLQDNQKVDFMQMSIRLGLHKDSYNYIS